jgi:drug/metabolite transporter (DMT)-like permease
MTLATMLWGATFVVARDLLKGIGAAELIFVRFATATLVFALVLALRPRPIGREALVAGVLSGLCATGGYLFQAIGLTTTTAGSSAFLTCTGTVFAALFAWPLLGERPAGSLLQGIALALAGSMLLSSNLGLPAPGELWTLFGAVVYALQIVVVARSIGRVDPIVLMTLQSLTVTLVLLPFAGHAPGQLAALGARGLVGLAYLAIAGTVAAPLLQVLAQRALPAGRTALLFALEPVFALLFALTIGGERFGTRWGIGAALILIGVARVEWRAAWAAKEAPSRAT